MNFVVNVDKLQIHGIQAVYEIATCAGKSLSIGNIILISGECKPWVNFVQTQ